MENDLKIFFEPQVRSFTYSDCCHLFRFAAGLLYNGLDTSSIQLLEDFYANYAVRELVNLLGFILFLLLATW